MGSVLLSGSTRDAKDGDMIALNAEEEMELGGRGLWSSFAVQAFRFLRLWDPKPKTLNPKA